MKAKTYTDYYNILLEGCKEAFKSIELKEYLYTDEAMEDNKEYFVSKDYIKQIGTNRSNNLIVNYQIERDMKTDFLRFLERQQQVFEKKYLIPRNEFYEKCLKSLNIKLTELNRQEYRVLKNISDMGTPPDPLLFLEYMKWDIKNKSLQTNKTPEPQQAKNIKTDEVIKELRNDIFKGNAIELFKHYYDCKSMVNNSRVHFRFLFEVMKEDGFIHDTVTLGQYIKFITKDFGYVDTELKSIDLNSKPNKNNLKDYNRYKEDLKTTLK